MSVTAKLVAALQTLKIPVWAISKPETEDPDVFIVYNPEMEYIDYGDDRDLDIETSFQVHWYARGHVNYLTPRKNIRNALRTAGFLLESSPMVIYESVSGNPSTGTQTGYTHVVIICRMEDE